jgi:hypothetical protein
LTDNQTFHNVVRGVLIMQQHVPPHDPPAAAGPAQRYPQLAREGQDQQGVVSIYMYPRSSFALIQVACDGSQLALICRYGCLYGKKNKLRSKQRKPLPTLIKENSDSTLFHADSTLSHTSRSRKNKPSIAAN